VGGPYGVGKRISIKHTRALLNAALTGKLDNVDYRRDPVFGFDVPTSCPEVPTDVLDPASSWKDKAEHEAKYKQLAQKFIDNFKDFADQASKSVLEAGPTV
jgi:phosphoenolpyruvate carboxykinase (ATP)